MEQTKERLTRVIETIKESFPDENDLKGFLGISRALIIEALTETEVLLISLKEYDNRFETIILKRNLAELFEKINKELEEKFDKIKPTQFNSILNHITKIRASVRDAYFAVVNEPAIRTEAEISKAKEELNLLSSNIEEIKKINTDLTTLKETTIQNITTSQEEVTALKDSTVKSINDIHTAITLLKESATKIVTDFEETQKTSTENEKKINDFIIKIEAHNTAIEAIEKNTILWEQEINKTKEEIAANSTEYTSLNTKSKTLQKEIEETHDKIFGKRDEEGKLINGYFQETEDLKNQIAEFLKEQQKKFLAQFTEIEGLLPGATSAGLAEAYRLQKESYKKPIQLWSTVFICTVSIMAILSALLLYVQFKSSTPLTLSDAFIALLKDLPFFVPTIWLAAYASKQQSQYKRLEQEYAFKETNAKSFHGHKMQIEELTRDGDADKDLLSELVAQLVTITAQNPSVTLDSKSHEDSPPVFKLLEKYLQLRKNKEQVKTEK